MPNKRNRKYKKSKKRKQYGGKYKKGGSQSRKKQRGGNLGQHYTLRPYNNLANGDIRNELQSTNGNNNVPIPYMKSGGGRGSFMQQFGVLGDLYNGALNIGNKIMDGGNIWNGKPTQSSVNSSHVTNQPINKQVNTDEFNFNYHDKYSNNLNNNINDVEVGGGTATENTATGDAATANTDTATGDAATENTATSTESFIGSQFGGRRRRKSRQSRRRKRRKSRKSRGKSRRRRKQKKRRTKRR